MISIQTKCEEEEEYQMIFNSMLNHVEVKESHSWYVHINIFCAAVA